MLLRHMCRGGQVHFAHWGIVELERQCMRSVPCGLPFLVWNLEELDFGWYVRSVGENKTLEKGFA